MFVSGFTFVRNAVLYGYPVQESILSMLQICYEVIVAIGKSEDETLALVRSLNDARVRIIETIWDDQMRTGGRVLAQQTDLAFAGVHPSADWCLYLRADEVLHEDDISSLREVMRAAKDDKTIHGLVFDYLHFIGSYDFIGTGRRWYRREVRVIRNNPRIKSWRDAQGFRWAGRHKLQVIKAQARVFHYGWVRPPEKQLAKQRSFDQLWHDDHAVQVRHDNTNLNKMYLREALLPFTGSHPQVMHKRIANQDWEFEYDPSLIQLSLKDRISLWCEKHLG